MHESAAWQTTLEEKGWTDAFQTGSEFASFLETNVSDVTTTLQNIGLIQ
jgi:putative tricarboxylic transport membrane protein